MSDATTMTAEEIRRRRVPILITSTIVLLFLGLVSVANGCARILFGMVADRCGTKRTMWILSAVAIVATVCVLAGLVTGAGALYVVGALLCGLAVVAALDLVPFGRTWDADLERRRS